MVMDTRLGAANRILNRGVRFQLPAPFFTRLFRRNVIEVRPLYPGTILEFATIVLENNLEEATTLSDYESLVKSTKPVARCIAVSMLNDERKIEEQTDKLQHRLLWKVQPELLVKIYLTRSELNRTSDFMNITRYFVIQTLMMMNPNLGQESDGR
jgi:hypothetical protein